LEAEERQSPAWRYGIALGTVLVATGISLLLRPFGQAADSPLFVAAVLVSAWQGGIGPALLATAIAIVPMDLVVAPSQQALGSVTVFVLVALFVGTLAAARRRAERDRLVLLERERAARLDAEAANRTKEQFVHMVVHELRTPLTAILSWAGALATGRLDGADAAKALAAIRRNAALQARIIEDLVDLAQVERGGVSLERGRVELAAVVGAAVEANTAAAASKGIKIALDVADSCPPVVGDFGRLQQVVSNLLTNALKHSEAGTTVCVRLDRTAAWARLTVADEGRGIAPELLPHVFEPYRQAGGDIARSGLGLGLTIVRHLVELHGGRVEAASPGVGGGARFTVLLPAVETRA
jgi:signal transduction histidine kinase